MANGLSPTGRPNGQGGDVVAVDAIHDFTGHGGTGAQALRISPLAGERSTEVARQARSVGRPDFGTVMKDFVGDVNALQFRAGHAIDQLVTGEAADVHQVMVAVEEAGIALDLMLEIRNRVMDGYQELIRMQV